MIIDHIKNRTNYDCLGNDIRAALDYFATVDGSGLKNEDVTIPGTDVIVKIRPMMTRDITECSFEAHKKYIDIHFVAYGTERIGYAEVNQLKEIMYDDESDAMELVGAGDILTLEQGYFMITFTQDAHMPCICKDQPEALGKMIAKIKV